MHAMRCRSLARFGVFSPVAGVAILMIGGCAAPDANSEALMASDDEWHVSADSTHRFTLAAKDACTECISVSREVVLGDDSNDGFVDMTTAVTLDSLGRWWVGQKGHLKVYEPSGALAKRVGRQGAGPSEFGKPVPVHTDATGAVHILDPYNQRETVVNSDFSIQRESRLPVTDFFSATSIRDGKEYALSAWVPNASSIGLAVHVVRGGDDSIRSFDAPEVEGGLQPFHLNRLLAADYNGHLFSAQRFSFDVVAFTLEGERVATFSGPQLNAHPLKGAVHNLSDNPLPSEILSIRADRQQRLWILSKRIRDNWKSHVVEVVRPNGQIGLEVKPGKELSADSFFTGRLEVVDLKRRRIVAHADLANLMDGFIAENLLFQNSLTELGTPRIVVWRISEKVP